MGEKLARSEVMLAACGIGLGHVGRLLPVAKGLKKKGLQPFFTTYGDSAYYSIREGFVTYKERTLSYGSKPDGSLSLKETFRHLPQSVAAFLSQIRDEFCIMRIHRPSVVVSDSRLSSLIAAKLLGIPSILVMHQFKVVWPIDERKFPSLRALKRLLERISLEVLGLGWDLAEVGLITDFPPPYTLCRPSVVVPEFLKHKVRYVGTVSPAVLRTERESARKTLGFEPSAKLLYFGVSGLPEERRKLTENLLPLAKSASERGYSVLFSRGEPTGEVRLTWDGNMAICDWLADRRLAYAAADVFINVGGQTSVGEAFRYGLPMIIVPTPNHTEHDAIATSIQDMGLGEKITLEDLSPPRFEATLAKVLGDHYADLALIASKKVVQFDASSAVVELITGYTN
jgi:UDP:flavonoid glycosyltransferase YjiC (YdhE family)